MKIRRARWTKEEKERLKEHYSTTTWDELLSLLPGRTRWAIYDMACKLGIRRKGEGSETGRGSKKKWTEAEKKIIILYYPKAPKKELLKKLLGRTWEAIKGRAQKLGMTRNPEATPEPLISGRRAEYRTAKFLWDNYQIVAFPSPKTVYDLLLINGIRLEVKLTENNCWKISSHQSKTDHFCDFLVLWADNEAFIIPYQEWIDKLKGKQNMSLKHVIQYKDRWDLIVENNKEQSEPAPFPFPSVRFPA